MVACRSSLRISLLAVLPLLALAACGGDTLYDPVGTPGEPGEPGEPEGPGQIHAEVTVDALDRMELTDSIVISVRAFDPESGPAVRRVGYSAVIRRVDDGTEIARTDNRTLQAAVGDTVESTFVIHPDWLDAGDLPADMALEIYGWGMNDEDGCAAAVPGGGEGTLDCRNRQVAGTNLVVGEARAEDLDILAVRGRTVSFPGGFFVVGDLQVDTLRERAYLANRGSNRLHVLDASEFAWAPDVNVGSEPWGLHLNATGDTLLVANSGGTSVSHVSLDGTPDEVVARRLQTRNTPLFEIGLADPEDLEEEEEDEDEEDDRPMIAGEVRFFDFSDRPQHVAQDAEGRVLYSTRPTLAAPTGTVRVIERQAGWNEHETRILARIPQDTRRGENTVAVMNVDSIVPYINGLVEVWDHRPGFPSQNHRSGIRPPLEALAYMATQTDSDIRFLEDRAWQLEAVSFSDTTHVATSRDRAFVAFGDGGEPAVGRVVLWHAASGTISNRLLVADLVNNASERVRALALNSDGSLGIARGAFGTYLFSNDLRLRGTVPEPETGGGGVALHPDHPDTPAPSASSSTTLAFTIAADRSVRILDTVHYTERGRVSVRDPVSGPLRVTPPFPSDNGGQGRNCSGSDCVVAKVFAVTEGGGVLVIDVRGDDIATLQ